MRTLLPLLVTLCAVVVPVGVARQASPGVPAPAASILESNTRARAIVDAAVRAHGGVQALSALDKSRIVLEGQQHWRHQSRRVTPPYDIESDRAELLIDLPKQRVLSVRWNTYPGGARRHTGFITDGPRGFSLDFRRGTHSAHTYPPADTQTGQLYHLPQYVLRDLYTRQSSLRSLGRMRLHGGDEVDVVAGATASGPGVVTAAFDPTTHVLRATLAPSADPLEGDVASEVHFVGYRQLNGILSPTRRVAFLNGEVSRDLTYTVVEPGFEIPASALVPPAGSVDITAALQVDHIQPLAPGIWAVGGGAAALVVAFADHVIVVDAPSNAASIISAVGTLAPGKPIRYVIPTHHHNDHSGGLPHFAAAGATIVSTAVDRPFMEKMARWRPGLTPAAATGAHQVRMEVMRAGTRTFTDGTRTVEIHHIGSGPHAEDMLVAWLPESGVLFQADLIEAPIGGILGPAANNETTMHFAEWLKRKGWTVKVFAGSHGFLPNAAAFEALVSSPIRPLR